MPLEKQILSLPFARGVDTKTDRFQVSAGKNLVVQNGYFETPQSIRKRNGYVPSANGQTYHDSGDHTSGTITAATGIWTHRSGTELLTADGDYLYSLSPESSFGPKWIRRTPGTNQENGTQYIPATLETTAIARNPSFLSDADSSGSPNEIQAFVWEAGNPTGAGARTTIMDSVSGTPLLSNVQVGASSATGHRPFPKVFTLGGLSFIYLVNEFVAGSARLSFYVGKDTGSGYAISAAIAAPINDIDPDCCYDAVVFAGKIYVAYRDTSGDIFCLTVDSTSARSSAVAITSGSVNPVSISVFGDSINSQVWFAYCNSSQAFVKILNASLVGTVLAQTTIATDVNNLRVITGIASPLGADATVLIETLDSKIRRVDVQNSGFFTANGTQYANAVLSSRAAIRTNTQIMYWIFYAGNIQHTYFLVSMPAFFATANKVVMGQASVGVGTGRLPTFRSPPSLNILDDGSYQAALTQITSATEPLPGVFSAAITLDTPSESAELASSTHLTGALLWSYDGNSVVEQNFLLYPEIQDVTAVVGTQLTPGLYSYIAVFEWIDAEGNLHQSAPSTPKEVTIVAGPNQATDVTIKNLWVTNKINARNDTISIGIYRTEANGAVYYRVNPILPPDVVTPGYYTITELTIVYFDDLEDSTIIGNPQLYTNGGEVDNGAPPAASAVVSYRNRLIVVPSEDPLSWWYSKQLLPATPVEFSPFFVQTIDQRGGPVTALAVMDDKLIFFKYGAVFYVVGDGPAPNGTGNDYTQGQLVTTDTGAINNTSIVTMPDGVMFQSVKGIELLDRSLATHYIGADVEAIVNGTTVTSAVLVASLNQVRFTLSSGVVVVYDYFVKDPNTGMGQWSVFLNHPNVAAVLYNGLYVYANSSGLVLTETPGSFSDNGVYIPIGVTGAWLSLAGLQGFQRIYKAMVLGTWKSAHNLIVGIAYDFDATIVQTETIVSTSAPANQYQWRILLNRQKCEAVQLSISDAQNGSIGEGLRISALALEVGAKTGLQKSPQTKTYG